MIGAWHVKCHLSETNKSGDIIMKHRRIRALYCAISMLGLAAASIAAADDIRRSEQRNVSHWVEKASKAGEAKDSQRVPITVFLSFKNQTALKNLIAAQATPGNSKYGTYLTPDQFRQQFAPDAADVAKVQRALRKMGFVIENTPKSGLFVEASGTVAQVKTSFGVTQDLYSYKGKVLRANAETPRLPAEIAGIVSYVAGLDDTAMLRQPNHISLRTHLASNSAAAPDAPPPPQGGINSPVCSKYWGDHKAKLSTAPGLYPQTLPWLICGYDPQQLRAAYGADRVNEDGSGVRVAIVDLYASPTIMHDANRYSAAHGLPKLTYLNFAQMIPPGLLDVPASDPCGPQGWYEEETLDVESVHSMAPGAFILFGGITCTDPGNAALYNIIDNRLADIVTNSYGFNGEQLPADFINAENQFFMQAAAEGMSVLFSSGDDGDVAAANGIASGSWEATSPYVTGVGGTSLALLNAEGDKKEWGWGTYRAYLADALVAADGKTIATSGVTLPFAFYSGSGGGPSLVMLAPDYQSNVPYSMSGFTTLADGTPVPLEAPHRVTPDISMVGDPYTGFVYGETYAITGDPILDAGCKPLSATNEYCEESIGGTSLSSPLFAGVLALVNQARFSHHKSAVGFVNPSLYAFKTGSLDDDSEAPIIKVKKPSSPTAVLRGYQGDPTRVRVVTINSTPNADNSAIIEGTDTSYLTMPGYDEITGLGTPNVPALIHAFSKL
jgi:subtilase family serine protease